MLDLDTICAIYNDHKHEYNTEVKEFSLGNRTFNFNTETTLLGVVNLSTDSWFNHAICYTPEQAIRRSKVLAAQGADIIDIGAEATSSNTERADQSQQVNSLLPVIEALKKEEILTSIETYYPEVAQQCLQAGANVINFTGTENSEEMYRVVAEHDAAIIMCYVQGKHARMVGDFDFSESKDPVVFLQDFFAREIDTATKLGVNKIFIDPAVGLGYSNFYYKYQNVSTRLAYQLQTLLNSFRLKSLGFPVFAQLPTPLEIFGEEVRSAQLLTGVFALLGKANLIRTHEISKIKAIVETLNAL